MLQELRAKVAAAQTSQAEMLQRAEEICAEADERAREAERRADKAEERASRAEAELKVRARFDCKGRMPSLWKADCYCSYQGWL
jgi:hypothetical protein